MARIFVYDNREFEDPNPELPVSRVKEDMAAFYPEIATAEVRETKRDENTVYEFQKRVGTKGRGPEATEKSA